MKPNDFSDPLTSFQHHSEDDIYAFKWSILRTIEWIAIHLHIRHAYLQVPTYIIHHIFGGANTAGGAFLTQNDPDSHLECVFKSVQKMPASMFTCASGAIGGVFKDSWGFRKPFRQKDGLF